VFIKKSSQCLKEQQMDNTKLDNTVFIVAEVGINHNGDMGLARESIVAAAEAGADSVKFQNYKTEDFITDRNLIFEYQSQGAIIKEPQYDMFKRCELTRDQLAYLKELCDQAGVLFHSTPTSVEGIADLQEIDCRILKNGSDYLTNLRLVRAMGETGLKTILSTGMATLSEIDDAVRTFRETGNEDLMLLHCTSSYPTPAEDVNLSRMATLRDAFDCEVGFSDHSDGTTAAIGATILGARWVEKHFTLSKDLPGPDHWFSINPEELRILVKSIRVAEKILGTPNISLTDIEKPGRTDFRLSCAASENIAKGEKLSLQKIAYKRPGNGLPPKTANYLEGLFATRNIKKGEQLKFDMFN